RSPFETSNSESPRGDQAYWSSSRFPASSRRTSRSPVAGSRLQRAAFSLSFQTYVSRLPSGDQACCAVRRPAASLAKIDSTVRAGFSCAAAVKVDAVMAARVQAMNGWRMRPPEVGKSGWSLSCRYLGAPASLPATCNLSLAPLVVIDEYRETEADVMKRSSRVPAFAAALTLLAGVATIPALHAETQTRAFRQALPPLNGEIRLANLAGRIEIVRGRGNEVVVDATIHAEAGSTAETQRLLQGM